jgi:hypothetical protein
MSATSRQQRLAKYAAVAIAALCMAESLSAVDESVFGTYSGDCSLNNEPVHIDLEIVKNERYGQGGGAADAILSISKNGETSPVARVTMMGGYRDVRQPRRLGDHSPPETTRQFGFRALDVSEVFGGSFRVQFTQEGGQLKGTLGLQPVRIRHRRDGAAVEPAQPASVPLVLSRSSSAKAESYVVSQPEAPSHLNPDEITGVYDGSLMANKRQFFGQLRLTREGASGLSGVLSFSATAGDTQPLGSFKLKGKYDPANNTFQLSSGGELTASDGLTLAMAAGNFDPREGKIRAQLAPGGGTLELTRNREKTAQLQAKNAEAAKRLSEGPVSLAQARTDEERRDAIVRWFSRLKAEYPDIDLHHTILGQISPKVVNLYGDEDFVPVFGTALDAMSNDERNYVKQLFRRLFATRETRDSLDGFGDQLDRPFVLPSGSFSYADVAPQVAYRRSVRKNWRETMDRLKTLSPTPTDYDALLSLEKKGTDPFHDLWPSEFRQFQEGIESAKGRLADGAATERLDKVLAKATGVDGARLLSDWINQQIELLRYVSADTRQMLKSRINQRADELLGEPLRKEGNSVAQLGEGLVAVHAGKEWYRHMRETYGFARGCGSFERAVGQLQARRVADLEVAAPEIIATVSEQTTAEGLFDVIENYLGVPGDEKTTAGINIAQAVAERKKVIPPEEPNSPELTNEQKIWVTIGAIFAGAVALDALAGPHERSDSGGFLRERPKCMMCGGRGIIPSDHYNGDIVGYNEVCPVCDGSGEGW